MKITVLGTGTSIGVPVIGCKCDVCSSADPHDRRLRSSAVVEIQGKRILIDCGPDFREQILRLPFGKLDAVLLTHEHYDHVGGVDDLRPFCVFGAIPIYAEALCVKHLKERMPYCFGENRYPGTPELELHVIVPGESIDVGGVSVLPIRVMHGKMPIVGFRIGRFAYVTDMSDMPEDSFAHLKDLDCLILNALRHTPHHSHQTIKEALSVVEKLGRPKTFLTHLAHTAGLHRDSARFLPEHVRFAYDGLVMNLSE